VKNELFNDGWIFGEFEPNTSFVEMNSSLSLTPVDIPHDWMIYHVSDLYKDSIGFYKKSFTVDRKSNHTYIVRFEGVYMDTKIFLNDREIFEWKYGYSTFDVDLSSHIVNGKNTICVVCTYLSPNTRWYSGAGIYRNVRFIDKEPVFFNMDGIYIHTEKEKDSFSVSFDCKVTSLISKEAVIKHSVYDKENNLTGSVSESVSLNNETLLNKQELTISKPHLWDINDPYLYTVKSELFADGILMDSSDNPLGLRTISFDSNKGFFLNERNVKINGVCMHHDLGALGAAMNKTALRRQFEKLLRMGVNSVRTSHNMPAVEVMELADEMGILIFSECFDMWERPKTTYDYARFFPEWFEKDIKSWVRRDRNHPSLFIWSIGNEIYDTHAGTGLKWTIALRDAIRKYDYNHNAYIGIGSNYIEWENAQICSNELELSGYNYGERLYDAHHQKYPHWCIFGSETASTVQSRGIYHFPYETRLLTCQDEQCSSLGNCTTNWGAKNAATVIADHRDRDFVFGQYLWTGWDYIGEPTPYHSKNSFFGQIDTAGFEKDTFYQYQAEWTDVSENPMVHLFPYWDFNEGQIIDVCAYSNAPFVELFLNGESLGKQEINHKSGKELQGHWKVPFKKGELIVKAMDFDGNIIATDIQKSFGDPASISIIPEKPELIANGEDLSFVEISLKDENDTFVANAKNRVFVSVLGAGRLVGLDNGDSTDYEEYKATSRRLFSGKLIAIIQSTDAEGEIIVNVSSRDLPDESVILHSVKADGPVKYSSEMNHYYPNETDDVPIRKIEMKLLGTSSLSKENPSSQVSFKLFPENATYDKVRFMALTKDSVEANFAKVEVTDSIATVTALGDGEFTLTAFAYNDKGHPEIISTLDFSICGMGKATYNPYEMIPGIEFSDSHSDECKLSFLGGVFVPPGKDNTSYLTYSDIDFGVIGSDEIHVPIFSFNDEMPFEIIEKGEIVFKGVYRAKSIYNTYQENIFKLNRFIKGKTNITLKFYSGMRFSLQGIYFTKYEKAYEKIFAAGHSSIAGDSYTVEEEAVTGIGNNVCIEFEDMNFTDGLSGIKICSRSRNEKTSLHLLFIEGESQIKQMVEVPGFTEYTEIILPLNDINTRGKVNLLFLPGTDFDLHYFEFIKA